MEFKISDPPPTVLLRSEATGISKEDRNIPKFKKMGLEIAFNSGFQGNRVSALCGREPWAVQVFI